MKHSLFGLGILCFSWVSLHAQAVTRSGQPQVLPVQPLAVTGLPCAGSVLFSEDFENGSSGWTVLDLDSLTPNSAMGLQPGWQERADYYDSTNTLMVTPSWYAPEGQSDDWLISPAIVLGSNPCLSWTAYSKDLYYKESYEVRVSTTNPDTAGFLAHPALMVVNGESEIANTRSVSLATYNGQSVFFAFRQVSDNKFVLALDDITVSNVNAIDIGVVAFDPPASDPGDTLTFTVEVGNFGSDTIRSFTMNYSIEGGATKTMSISDLSLAPNGIHTFTHTEKFVSDSVEAFYDFCAWTSQPNAVADQDVSNDSLCDRFAVGTPVGMGEPVLAEWDFSIFPNPTQGELHVELKGNLAAKGVQFEVMDLQGRVLWEMKAAPSGGKWTLNPVLPADGLYFLRVSTVDGRQMTRKIRFQ